MYDLISVGNISLDIFFSGKSLTFKDGRFQLAVGGKYFVDKLYQSVGGGGANVAIGASHNGLKTAVLGKIGHNPFKSLILSDLNERNVSTELCQFEDNYMNISAILLNDAGERSIIHYSPLHEHILKTKKDLKQILETRIIYLGNLPDVALTERDQLLHFVHKNNIETIANLGVKDCRRPKQDLIHFLRNIDILIVNGHEFADLVKAQYQDIHFKDKIVEWYIPQLKEKLVIITEGEKGSFAYIQNQTFHQKAIEVKKIIDTTGAGDAYTAAFIAEYFKTKDIEKAMERGAKYAAKILSKIGAN